MSQTAEVFLYGVRARYPSSSTTYSEISGAGIGLFTNGSSYAQVSPAVVYLAGASSAYKMYDSTNDVDQSITMNDAEWTFSCSLNVAGGGIFAGNVVVPTLTVAQGTITSNDIAHTSTATWNNSSVAFTHQVVDITATAVGSGSKFIEYRLSGSGVAWITYGGGFVGTSLAVSGTITGGGISGTSLDISKTSLASTSTDGITAVNATASTVGATVQMSPRIRLGGSAWKSSATAESQTHNYVAEVLPVTGSSVTTSSLRIGYSFNGGSYSYPIILASNGDVTLGANLAVNSGSIGTNYIGASSGAIDTLTSDYIYTNYIDVQGGTIEMNSGSINNAYEVYADNLYGYLSASYISGTIADGNLSSNVPLKNGTNVFSGANSFSSGSIALTNGTANRIFYGSNGVAAPGSGSAGQKIQLYGTSGTVSAGDYAIGIESGNTWFSSGGGYKFYNSSSSVIASLTSSGVFTAASSLRGGTQASAQWDAVLLDSSAKVPDALLSDNVHKQAIASLTLGTSTGAYSMIGSINEATVAGGLIYVHLQVSGSGRTIYRTYACATQNQQNGNVYMRVPPLLISSTENTTDDFDFELAQWTGGPSFRIHRKSGTNSLTVRATVQWYGSSASTFTANTNTGTDSTYYTDVKVNPNQIIRVPRTIATTTDAYSEIGTITDSTYTAQAFRVYLVTTTAGGTATWAATYDIALRQQETGLAWWRVPPTQTSDNSTSQTFDLEALIWTGGTSLRIRRRAGSTATTLMAIIVPSTPESTAFTPSSTTGTVSGSLSDLYNFDTINARNNGYFNGSIGIGTSTLTGKLSFVAATTAAGGIAFGTDTNLYRNAADSLKTDDSLVVVGSLTAKTLQTTLTSTSVTGTYTVTPANGEHWELTVTGNVTITVSSGSFNGQRIWLRIAENGTGGYTISINGGSNINNLGYTNTFNTAANKINHVGLKWHSGSSKWEVVAFRPEI